MIQQIPFKHKSVPSWIVLPSDNSTTHTCVSLTYLPDSVPDSVCALTHLAQQNFKEWDYLYPPCTDRPGQPSSEGPSHVPELHRQKGVERTEIRLQVPVAGESKAKLRNLTNDYSSPKNPQNLVAEAKETKRTIQSDTSRRPCEVTSGSVRPG